MVQANNEQAPGWKPGFSHYKYDVNGHLIMAADIIGNRSYFYTTNAQGLILKREEFEGVLQNKGTIARQFHNYYYLDGHRIGDVGNDGDARVDYVQALASRGNENKDSKYSKLFPVASADFDQNYQPINAEYPAQTPTSYTVRNGDTLQGIAFALWGDRSMWYLIADANGLTGSELLTAGQVLSILNKVTNIHNNSATMKVYNPGEAIGNTSPTLPDVPPPPASGNGKKGCGVVGQVIAAIVAIVVTIYTAGAASAAFGVVAGSTSTSVGTTMAAERLLG